MAELGEFGGIVRYKDVAVVSLLSADLERLERFVRRELGELATGGEPATRLRETLPVWLQEGGNARRAAERLHTHKNTVLYRVARAGRSWGGLRTTTGSSSRSRSRRRAGSARA